MPKRLRAKIRNAGAIFIGAHTPEAIGDYVAGSNHVLPTARSARFSSGLGVLDFMKRTSLLKCGPEQLRALGPAAIALGEAEGLAAPCPLGGDPPQSAMSPAKSTPAAGKQRLVSVTLDEESIGRSNEDVEHEREVAIYDLLEQNTFAPVGHDGGPYALHLTINGNRLVFDIRLRGRHAGDGASVFAHAAAPDRQGLLHDLRQLLSGHPHGDARQDRGDRHGPARHPQRRLAHPDRAAQGQGDGRCRHRAPPVHVDLRAALERLRRRSTAERGARPQAVLFACGMNAVRSPMAAGLFQQMFGKSVYVGSAGVQRGELDPFAVAVMEEIGIDIARHKPVTFEDVEDLEGLNFDLIVTLSPPAHHKALELTRTNAAEVEYWPTIDPTSVEGSREQRLEAYRAVRDELMAHIRERFGQAGGGNE